MKLQTTFPVTHKLPLGLLLFACVTFSLVGCSGGESLFLTMSGGTDQADRTASQPENAAAKDAVGKRTSASQAVASPAPQTAPDSVALKNGQVAFRKGTPVSDNGTRLLLHFEEPASEPEAVVIKDDSRHHHRVSMHGDAMIVSDGRSGNGLRLGPKGGWITVKDSPALNLSNDFLIEFWFKPDENLPLKSEPSKEIMAKRYQVYLSAEQ